MHTKHAPPLGPPPGKASLLRSYLKDKYVASITPTSRFGVERICKMIDFHSAKVIVEYGPGTGVISRGLLKKMAPDAKLVLIESNGELAQSLVAMNDPRVIVAHASAEDVDTILQKHGLPPADAVVSGIPFSQIPPALRRSIVERTGKVLSENGNFIAYQFRGAVYSEMLRTFGGVHVSYEFFNMPPLWIFRATKQQRNSSAVL